jgi:hypothetical protein
MMKELDRGRPWWLLPPTRVASRWWLITVGLLLVIEYATGIYAQFPVIYVIPVALAAYYSGRRPALILAVAVPFAHLAFTLLERTPEQPLLRLVATSMLRGSVVVFMALWFARLSEHERALHHEVETLKGLLPICSFCKSIKNDSGEWEHLERFISRRSQTQFSHGICPSCIETQYASLAQREKR